MILTDIEDGLNGLKEGIESFTSSDQKLTKLVQQETPANIDVSKGTEIIDTKIENNELQQEADSFVQDYETEQKNISEVDLGLSDQPEVEPLPEPNPWDVAFYETQMPIRHAHYQSQVKGFYDNMIKDEFLSGVEGDRTPMQLEHKNRNQWDESQDWKQIGKNKHNPITGLSGTIAFRNNNPGALKLEFKGAVLGKTTTKRGRSRATALAKAKELYDGVVTLDRAGFVVFDNKDYGKAAQERLMMRRFKGDTIKQMLPKYAIKDGSGDTHHWNYYKAIVSYGDSKGVDLRERKIGDFNTEEMKVMTFAMAKVEGGV